MAETLRRPEPRLPLLVFGNGLQGRVMRIKEGIVADDGEKITEIEFQPTRELMFQYDLQLKDLNNQDRLSFIRRYPSVFIWALSQDPTNQTFLVLCDFYGRDTALTGLWSTLLENNRSLQKTVNALRNENAVLHVNIKKATSRQGEFQKDVISGLKETLKLRSWPSYGMGGPEDMGGSE